MLNAPENVILTQHDKHPRIGLKKSTPREPSGALTRSMNPPVGSTTRCFEPPIENRSLAPAKLLCFGRCADGTRLPRKLPLGNQDERFPFNGHSMTSIDVCTYGYIFTTPGNASQYLAKPWNRHLSEKFMMIDILLRHLQYQLSSVSYHMMSLI
jgi:hypothetical protein